jgi:hypothetical protein
VIALAVPMGLMAALFKRIDDLIWMAKRHLKTAA